MRVVLLALLLTWPLGTSGARAQEADAEDPSAVSVSDDAEARSLFEAGEQAFTAGNYERALVHFRHAYELSRRDALLYNIAVAADRLRRDEEALEAFEGYLASPAIDEELRPQVQARIAVLRAEIGEDTVTHPTHADVTAPTVLLVVGSVLAVGAAVLFGVGAAENDAVQGAPMGAAWADYAGRLDAANGLFTAGGAAAAVGVGFMAAGAMVLATTHDPSPERARLELVPGLGSLLVRGTF